MKGCECLNTRAYARCERPTKIKFIHKMFENLPNEVNTGNKHTHSHKNTDKRTHIHTRAYSLTSVCTELKLDHLKVAPEYVSVSIYLSLYEFLRVGRVCSSIENSY